MSTKEKDINISQSGEQDDSYCSIFKVGGWLDSRGFDKRIHRMGAKETEKSFIADGKRISKDKLMKVDTVFVENHTSMRYFTYCREEQIQDALNLIKAHIIEKVKTYKKEIDVLAAYCSLEDTGDPVI